MNPIDVSKYRKVPAQKGIWDGSDESLKNKIRILPARKLILRLELMEKAGLYVHIPFCKRKCTYCNFHFSTRLETKPDLLTTLKQEMVQRSPEASPYEIGTLYFGGGTPGMLQAEELSSLMETLRTHYHFAADPEITLEANPDDVNPESLEFWHRLGINRLSIGIQSLNDEVLRWMNRPHDADQSRTALRMIVDSGWHDFTCDLIYGIPGCSDEEWLAQLSWLTGSGVPHLSCYALTVEPHTALHHQIHRKGKMVMDDDLQARQMLLMLGFLQTQGYEAYEISNFCLPGRRSMHNSSYWEGRPYLGFGPSAHSFDGRQKRRWNLAHNPGYIKAIRDNEIYWEEEQLSPRDLYNEYVMLQLRRSEGLDLRSIQNLFPPFYHLAEPILMQYCASGHLVVQDNRFVLTPQGKLLCDRISMECFA